MIDTKELRRLAQQVESGEAGINALVAFVESSEPKTIIELLDRLEQAEKERDNANAAAVNIALEAERLQGENDTLRAKIEQMEKQEPIAYMPLSTRAALEAGGTGVVWNCHGRGAADEPLYALPGAQAQPAPSVPDGVAEALQRLIENGAVLGPSSSEDALLVARYRQHLLSSAPSISPAALRPVIQWLRNGCDPMKAAKELEILIEAAPEAKP